MSKYKALKNLHNNSQDRNGLSSHNQNEKDLSVRRQSANRRVMNSESFQELLKSYEELEANRDFLLLLEKEIYTKEESTYQSAFICSQIKKLQKLSLKIKDYKNECKEREDIIKSLKKYEEVLSKAPSFDSEKIKKQLGLMIYNLRIRTINIVLKFKAITKKMGLEISKGVFKEFNHEYILKIMCGDDIYFLSQGKIGKMFIRTNKKDAFFTDIKRDVPFDQTVSQYILKCKYFFTHFKVLLEMKNTSRYNSVQESYSKETNDIPVKAKPHKISIDSATQKKRPLPPPKKQKEIQKELSTDNVKINNNKEEKKENEKEEKQPLYEFQCINDNLSTFNDFYFEYFKSIPSNIKIAFNIQEEKNPLDSFLKGAFPHIIHIRESNKVCGLAVLAYRDIDQLFINHISCRSEEELSPILLSLIEHISKVYSHKELFIEFYYEHKNDNSFVLYKPIEKILTSVCKFRWVNMENDLVVRKIKYKIINKDFKEMRPYPGLKINYNSLMNLKEKTEDEEDKSCEQKLIIGQERNLHIFPMLSLFSDMMYENDEYHIENDRLFQKDMEAMKAISNDINLINDFSSLKENKLKCSIKFELSFFFKNTLTTMIEGKKYNRISFDAKLPFLSLSSGEKFYMLKGKSEKMSILLYEKTEKESELNKYFESGNENSLCCIGDYMDKIYSEMSESESSYNNIYLPVFDEIKIIDTNGKGLLDEFVIESQEGNFSINRYNQTDKIKFEGDSDFIKFPPENSDLIIKNDFLVSIVNFDALNELEIPTIASYIVKIKK